MTKTLRTVLLLVMSSVLLAGCNANLVRQESRVLSAAEVNRLFVGNTVESYNLNTGFNSFTYYHPNGQALQERLWTRRIGSWQLKPDGQICLEFVKGKPRCRHIVQQGGTYYKVIQDKSGEHEQIIRYRYFRQGDALSGL